MTSKPRENTELVLKKYKINVDLLVTGDDVVNGKPANEGGKIVKSFFNEKILFMLEIWKPIECSLKTQTLSLYMQAMDMENYQLIKM